jgi:peptide-methionine (S)-S-oxide reductase
MSEEIATLGGGCFWCLEAVYKELRGVIRVKSGYSGGHTTNPTYYEVCAGETGHAEVVQVTFDPAELTYADVLRVFFTIHNPTTLNRQGNDVGPQYRSVIFTHSEEQLGTVLDVLKEVLDTRMWPSRIVTEVTPFTKFYPAEDVHDDYFAKHPENGYCQVVVGPKLSKFRKQWTERLKRAAAK